MSSNNWRCAYLEMNKLLKQLNSYVDAGDWINVRRIVAILKYNITFETAREKEHRRQIYCGDNNK